MAHSPKLVVGIFSFHSLFPPGPSKDFVRCIKNNVKPAKSRELIVEKMDGLWDWQQFLEPLDRTMSGLAIIEKQQDVNFAFRIVTRKDMKNYIGYDKWVEMADESQQVRSVELLFSGFQP